MKLALMLFLIAFCCLTNFAQNNSLEKDFEKNKPKFKLEKLADGEDATSGYDYLIYKEKDKIVKIREIWSSSYKPIFWITDYFYKDGKMVLQTHHTFPKKYYKTAIRGTNIPLKLIEKLFLTNSKLTVWIENGKTIPSTDKRWQEKENETVTSGTSMLETYEFLKDNK